MLFSFSENLRNKQTKNAINILHTYSGGENKAFKGSLCACVMHRHGHNIISQHWRHAAALLHTCLCKLKKKSYVYTFWEKNIFFIILMSEINQDIQNISS